MDALFNFGRNKRLSQIRVQPGNAGVVVAVPHGADDDELGATTLAVALGRALNARTVVARDVHGVDVARDPAGQPPGERYVCLHYQNEVFAGDPALVLECYAEGGGQYDFELSPGFDLTPTLRSDARFLERLHNLREALSAAWAADLPVAPAVGVRGIDAEVTLGADAYALSKLRHQRSVLGLERFGLRLALTPRPALRGALAAADWRARWAKAVAGALRGVFAAELGVQEPSAPAPLRGRQALTPLMVGYTLVVGNPHGGLPPGVVGLHASDVDRLGLMFGDSVMLQHEGREIALPFVPWPLTSPGEVSLPSGVRQQLHLNSGAPVTVGLPHVTGTTARLTSKQRIVVVQVVAAEKRPRLALGPEGFKRLGLIAGQKVRLSGHGDLPPVEVEAVRESGEGLSEFSARLGGSLAEKLLLSSGDVAQLA
jgi:hypothetical protein